MCRSKRIPAFSLAAVLMTLAASAHGASGSFSVGVQVLPPRSAPELLVEVPLPASATQSPTGPADRTVAVLHGGLDAALAHFHAALPALGYRLDATRDSGDRVRQVWSRGDDQVCVDLDLAMPGPRALVRLQLSGYGGAPGVAGPRPAVQLAALR